MVLIEQMDNLAKSLAWSFARTSGQPFEDLLSEARLALLEIAPRYDPERGAASTFAHRIISNQLREAIRKWRRGSGSGKAVAFQIQEPQQAGTELKLMLESLSSEAAAVLDLLCHIPAEVLSMGKKETPMRMRQGLKRALREHGWTEARIRKAFEEIKGIL